MGKGKSTKSKISSIGMAVCVAMLAYFVKQTVQSGDPIIYIIPNMLLYTPLRETTRFVWGVLDPRNRLPEFHEHPAINEIPREGFSFEALKECTEGFRHPCVIRGMFEGTVAMKKWLKKGYLSSKIGHFDVPFIQKATYGKPQNNRSVAPFGPIADEIITEKDSKKYLFFPVKSRFQFNGSNAGTMDELIGAVNDLVNEDLELDRVWPGFGETGRKNFMGSQLIMGRGTNSTATTTGTGWHCAPGNNYFAMVAGEKRWYFMDPKYSSFMLPLRGGLINMMTGTLDQEKWHDRLPLSYGDIRAGDLLYNPDWYWHTIQNRDGLAMGCPIREGNFTKMVQNNKQYTGIIAMNKVAQKLGINIGGYPD